MLRIKLSRSIYHSYVGRLFKVLLMLCTMMIASRILEVRDFGAYAIFVSMLTLSLVPIENGMQDLLLRNKKIWSYDLQVISYSGLILSVGLAGILLTYVSRGLFDCLDFLLILLNILIRIKGIVGEVLLKRRLRYKQLVMADSIGLIGGSATTIILAFLGSGKYSLIVGLLIQAFSKNILLIYFSPIKFRLKKVTFFEVVDSMIQIGRLSGIRLLSQASSLMILSELTRQLGTHAGGLINRASSLVSLPSSHIIQPQVGVYYSYLTKFSPDSSFFFTELHKLFEVVVGISTVMSLFIIIFADLAIILLFGEQWLESTLTVRIFAIASFFEVICVVLSMYLVISKRELTIIYLKCFVILIVLVIYFVNLDLSYYWFVALMLGIVFVESLYLLFVLFLKNRYWSFKFIKITFFYSLLLLIGFWSVVKEGLLFDDSSAQLGVRVLIIVVLIFIVFYVNSQLRLLLLKIVKKLVKILLPL